ncbi:MAG: KUP/HAK/KT family potassium transporter [Bacteroidia bacterium]|nr:KUP/HAK/KT family potassium transporter [Bacteroidia bacterium]
MLMNNNQLDKVSFAGLLVSLGIVFGDIGTSPLYVMKAILEEDKITREIILGGLSCIFWTLTIQTTLKYVLLTLRADNKGEGGIFSLFALVRKRRSWLIIPAMIGGSALLADGIITPPISVSSAIEGLRILNPQIPTVPIVIGIITVLFLFQQFGTHTVGKAFGPMMFIWFSMLSILGLAYLTTDFSVLAALSPHYAIHLLTQHPKGFWLLGAVFLCTTGAEALYSDLGHCGRGNIRVSWIFVKLSLVLNYFGQGAWLLAHQGETLNGRNPFYALMPEWFVLIGIIIATAAAIIASQALISGSFTLISEAMRLNLWPKIKVQFPTEQKGQLYVPGINWLLYVGCLVVVLYFRESSNMEAAYGLSITLTMLMTTILLSFYLTKHFKKPFVLLIAGVFILIELGFLIANLRKFTHGGWFTLVIGSILFLIMFIWNESRSIKDMLNEYVELDKFLQPMRQLSNDVTIPKFATHLVYMTGGKNDKQIESKVIYSIFQRQPKRADIYWFIHIDVTDEPYTMEYKADIKLEGDVIYVLFRLGFRVEQKINVFFRKVVEELVKNKEVDITSRYSSLQGNNTVGDFRFVVLQKFLSNDNDLPFYQRIIMNGYFFLKSFGLSEEKSFGLDTSNVLIEKFPMLIRPVKDVPLKRIFELPNDSEEQE